MKPLTVVTAALAASACASAVALPAQAAWKPVHSGDMNISDLTSLARTADGILHVGYRERGDNVLTTAIAPTGAVGATSPIVSGWAQAGDPVLIAQGSGLTAFLPGSPTTVTGDPGYGLNMATSADGGATWSLGAQAIADGNDNYAGARNPAVVPVNGSFLQAWYGVSETRIHVAVNPAVPSVDDYGDGQDQGLAVAADGSVMLAYCNPLGADPGVYAAPVDSATGAPAGPSTKMPSTSTCPANKRTQVVAREGGGMFVGASGSGDHAVLVWKVGDPSPAVLSRAKGFSQHVALTAAPGGRLWAGWRDGDSGDLVVSRSNPTATRWGAQVRVDAPRDQQVYDLDLAAQADRADAILRTANVSNVNRLWSTQVRPGLSLIAQGGKTQRFTVLDAGDPVPGATVRVAGRALTTGADGRVSADLSRGRYTVKASKAGYVEAGARVRAR